MSRINPFLDCTIYSRIVVHIGQNNQSTNGMRSSPKKNTIKGMKL